MPSSAGSGPTPDARVGPVRFLRESLPIAGITLGWLIVSWFAGHPSIGTGARYAGVVMAGAYAVVRGVALARQSPIVELPTPGPLGGDPAGSAWLFATRSVPPDLLRGNLAAMLAGGAWLLAARSVLLVESAWNGLGLPGLFRSPAPGLVFVLTVTGVLTVVLVAVTVGFPLVRSTENRERGAAPTGD